ncbi:MAG: GNAT family N-acetyltransferase [Aestuariivirga sp.]|nr:GNAT family N-acetyltransferase [Aestuariivirga sp.]
MIIRELTSSEYDTAVPSLANILVDAVDSGAGVTFMHPLSPDVAEAYWMKQKADVASGQITVFVADKNGVIAGTVMLQRVWPPNQPHRCEVAKLLVHRDFRRRGLATLLMQALEAKAKALGFTLITFDTVAKSPAEAFYRQLGFTCAGYIPNYAYAKGKLDGTALFYKEL